MKLLRRNDLDRSKMIGLIAFTSAVLLFILFFQKGNKDQPNTSVQHKIDSVQPKNPS